MKIRRFVAAAALAVAAVSVSASTASAGVLVHQESTTHVVVGHIVVDQHKVSHVWVG